MEAIDKFFTSVNDWFIALFAQIGDAWVALCTTVFKPVLILFFGPINTFLAPIYQPWATITAIGFFVGTMLWVAFVLKESLFFPLVPIIPVWLLKPLPLLPFPMNLKLPILLAPVVAVGSL